MLASLFSLTVRSRPPISDLDDVSGRMVGRKARRRRHNHNIYCIIINNQLERKAEFLAGRR